MATDNSATNLTHLAWIVGQVAILSTYAKPSKFKSIPSKLFVITKSVIVFINVARLVSFPIIFESSPSLVLSVSVGKTFIPRL